MEIGDLSLHAVRDRDFLDVSLPDFTDPAYSVNDINTSSVRERFGDSETYRPAVMPECAAVQRKDPGPSGADRNVYVNVTTELVIEAVAESPPENTISPRPAGMSGEALHIYGAPDENGARTRNPPFVSGSTLRKRIVCPKDLEDLERVLFSFGERPDERDLLATGGYKISLSYVSSIERGIPAWATDPGVTGGVGPLDCFGLRPFAFGGGRFPREIDLPGLATLRFPHCGLAGFERVGFFDRHPLRPPCLADGPGCFSLRYFFWPGAEAPLDMAIAAEHPLLISLLNADGEVIAETQLTQNSPPAFMDAFQGAALDPQGKFAVGGQLKVGKLAPGYYGFKIQGMATELALSFKAPAFWRQPQNLQQALLRLRSRRSLCCRPPAPGAASPECVLAYTTRRGRTVT